MNNVPVNVNALQKAHICTAVKLKAGKQMSHVLGHVNVLEKAHICTGKIFPHLICSDYRKPIAIP